VWNWFARYKRAAAGGRARRVRGIGDLEHGRLRLFGDRRLHLLNLQTSAYNTVIGLILVAYGSTTILLPAYKPRSAGPFGDLLAGAMGGITGPLAAFPGAGAVIWCGMRGWNKDIQRSVYQPYILIMQLAAIACLVVLGEVGRLHLGYALFAVPGVLGAHLGFSVFGRLSGPQFRVFVTILLIVSGVSMLGI
jgi:uncharacterized protein